jgi:hypothetical protein
MHCLLSSLNTVLLKSRNSMDLANAVQPSEAGKALKPVNHLKPEIP